MGASFSVLWDRIVCASVCNWTCWKIPKKDYSKLDQNTFQNSAIYFKRIQSNYQIIKRFFLSSRWITDNTQHPKKSPPSSCVRFAAPKDQKFHIEIDEENMMSTPHVKKTTFCQPWCSWCPKTSRWVESGWNVEGCKTHSHRFWCNFWCMF